MSSVNPVFVLSGALAERSAAIAKELTKLHEEIWRGTVEDALRHFEKPRGEFVLIVGGRPKSARLKWTQARVQAAVRKRLDHGEAPTALAAQLAAESGWTRREIYKLASIKR